MDAKQLIYRWLEAEKEQKSKGITYSKKPLWFVICLLSELKPYISTRRAFQVTLYF